MSKLERELKDWVNQGFINKKQADQIYEYQANKASHSWILFGVLVLGIIVISIGLISLIAANWNQISDSVKLAADFILLILMGIFAIRAWNAKNETQVEVILLFFILFILASIGLISQVYNTGGELYQALMLWSLITLPIAIIARYIIIPFIWTAGFLIGVTFTLLNSPTFYFIFKDNIHALIMTGPLFCACLMTLSYYANLHKGVTLALKSWVYITAIFAIIAGETISDLVYFIDMWTIYNYLPVYLFALLSGIAILSFKHFNITQKVLLLLILGVYLIFVNLSLTIYPYSLVYAILTISILILFAVFLASEHQRRAFQWILFLIGLRFLILYFQAFGGLAQTGIGLILFGLLIVILAVLWSKYKLAIALWVERRIQ